MSKALVNPLQGLLVQAQKLPERTGTVQRCSDSLSVNGPSLIIADVSGSMNSPAWGGQSKIKILRSSVAECLGKRPGTKLIAFSDYANEVFEIPHASGSTALHTALLFAERYKPSVTLVISDGQPDDSEAAIAQARLLTGIINVLYIGPDCDVQAIDFMRRLSRVRYGECFTSDLTKQHNLLGSTMQRLLIR